MLDILKRHLETLARLFLLTFLLACPFGAFAMAQAHQAGTPAHGVGFVLLMTLQRIG